MKRSNKKGFTIVELVIVIAIIAILAAVLIPTFASLVQKANESNALAEAKNLVTEMLTEILLGKEGDADLLVFSEKGSDVYAYAYSRTEGKIIAYKNNPTAKTGTFEETVTSILTVMSDAGAITDCNVNNEDWRHPDKIKDVVKELNTKGSMIVYANYTINADKFAVHVHSFGAWENADATNHIRRCSCGATETATHEWESNTVNNVKIDTCKVCHATKTEVMSGNETHHLYHHIAKAATCVEAGNIEYWECVDKDCGKYFSDSTATSEITDKNSVKLAKLVHDWGNWTYVNETNHTRKCKNCDATENEGHNIDVDGKCTECNYEITTSSAVIVNKVEALAGWARKDLDKDTVVKLAANMTLSKETVFNVKNEHVFNLDLNGKTLTIDGAEKFIVKGDVTISDTSAGKTGKIIAKEGSNFAGGLITVKKTDAAAISGSNNLCTVENVTIDATANKNPNACAIEMYNGGSVTVNNGAVIRANGYAISGKADDNAFEQGKLIIDGGHIESTGSYAIYHPQKINKDKGAQFVINGGTIKGKTGAIYLANNKNKVEKKLEINGGELISDGEWIIYVDSTELRKTTKDNWIIRIFVNGGNFKASNGNAHFARLEMKEANRLATGAYMKGSSCVSVYLKGGTYTNITSDKGISYLDMAPEKTEGKKTAIGSGYKSMSNADGTWSVVAK